MRNSPRAARERKRPPASVPRDLIYTAIWNSLFALFFTALSVLNETRRTTAIIADDEPRLAQYLRDRLAALWPDLVITGIADNGAEAKVLIDAEQPDIAFLGIRMPGMSGLDVANARRAGGVVASRAGLHAKRQAGTACVGSLPSHCGIGFASSVSRASRAGSFARKSASCESNASAFAALDCAAARSPRAAAISASSSKT